MLSEIVLNLLQRMELGQKLQITGSFSHFLRSSRADLADRYFGTTGHAQMAQSLIVATGSDYGLMDSNPGMKLSALYHMAVTGMQGLFAYGDTGPNKYTATANGIMFYGSYFSQFSSSLALTLQVIEY